MTPVDGRVAPSPPGLQHGQPGGGTTSAKGNPLILIVENDPEVPPGVLESLLVEADRKPRIVRPHGGDPAGSLAGVDGLVVLGGTMSTRDTRPFPFLRDVKRLMASALQAQIPLLGICLGGQLLAEVSGGEVTQSSHGEHGLHDIVLSAEGRSDPLFTGLPERFTVFQWHGDSFTPPRSAVLLAGSPACAHQAFRVGRTAYGLQFHPEVDPPIVSAWAAGSPSSSRILEAFAEYRRNGLDRAAHQLLKNFIRMIP